MQLLLALALAASATAEKPLPEDDKSLLEEMLESEDEKEAARASGPRSGKAAKEFTAQITDEVAASSSQSTPQNPRQGQIANALQATFYAGQSLALNAGLNLTLESGLPPPRGSPFRASYGGSVALVSLGFDWDPSDHLTLGLRGDLSPKSEQFTSTLINFPAGQRDGLLRTRNSSLAGAFTAGYDTDGDSDFETAITVGATFNALSSEQNLEKLEGADGSVVDADEVRDLCRTRPTLCSRALKAALTNLKTTLVQARLSAAITETIFDDTDLTLSGDYYLYSKDPTELGFFSVATAGRVAVLGGGGVPIAPLHWALRPEVAHRFGQRFSVRLWAQAGRYVEGGGQGTASAGLRLQFKFSRAFRLWLNASGQRDTDIDGVGSRSGTLGLGAGYRF